MDREGEGRTSDGEGLNGRVSRQGAQLKRAASASRETLAGSARRSDVDKRARFAV